MDINMELLLEILRTINYPDPHPILLENIEVLRKYPGQTVATHVRYLAEHNLVVAGITPTFDFHPQAQITLAGKRFLQQSGG